MDGGVVIRIHEIASAKSDPPVPRVVCSIRSIRLRRDPSDPKWPGYDDMCKRFKSRFGIDDEYEFEGNSEKAWAVLHEATRPAPDLNRIVGLHNGEFKKAFAALEQHVTGNLNTASRNMRRELQAKIRECNSAKQVPQLITLIERGNMDLVKLAKGHEFSEHDIYEEVLDVLLRTPELKHIHQLARMPSSEIATWAKLKTYLNDVCLEHQQPAKARENRGTVLAADRGRSNGRGRGRGRGGRDGGRANSAPPNLRCWRCGGNHYSLPNSAGRLFKSSHADSNSCNAGSFLGNFILTLGAEVNLSRPISRSF